ncbi:MAG: LysR family transcriptional regulator, partial [Maritimibacter sp.]
MLAPRRFLPSISSLLALEAVDRLGSATAAAEELALTHSAVSRQLKVLEGQLGVTLLVRDGKSLRLTRAGETYSQSARTILGDLARA